MRPTNKGVAMNRDEIYRHQGMGGTSGIAV
jgi:hypothetical protein